MTEYIIIGRLVIDADSEEEALVEAYRNNPDLINDDDVEEL